MTDLHPPMPRAASTRVKVTRASKLAAALRGLILQGELKPGAKVSLDQLRDTYQVSLSPLREAIARLVSVGLVEMEDQRGYRIAPVSMKNLREITTLRATLEAQALSEGIARADLEWESAVLGALHRLNRSSPKSSDPDALKSWREAHRHFHNVLIANCDMPLLIDLCRMIFDLHARYINIFGGQVFDEQSSQENYKIIAEAAVARDADTAVATLVSQINQTGSTLADRVNATMNQTSSQELSK